LSGEGCGILGYLDIKIEKKSSVFWDITPYTYLLMELSAS
jgi:hypothetical protein